MKLRPDAPASQITKREMAIFMAMQGLCANPDMDSSNSKWIASLAIDMADTQIAAINSEEQDQTTKEGRL